MVEYLLHQSYLLYDMSGGMRLNAWWQHVQSIHSLVVAVSVILCHLHRFQFFQACFLGYLVLPFICIVFQMAHIRDVAHIAHLISQMLEVAEQQVERDGRACMSQVWITIDSRTAYIHAYMGGMQRLEQLLAACQRIVDEQVCFHKLCF